MPIEVVFASTSPFTSPAGNNILSMCIKSISNLISDTHVYVQKLNRGTDMKLDPGGKMDCAKCQRFLLFRQDLDFQQALSYSTSHKRRSIKLQQ